MNILFPELFHGRKYVSSISILVNTWLGKILLGHTVSLPSVWPLLHGLWALELPWRSLEPTRPLLCMWLTCFCLLGCLKDFFSLSLAFNSLPKKYLNFDHSVSLCFGLKVGVPFLNLWIQFFLPGNSSYIVFFKFFFVFLAILRIPIVLKLGNFSLSVSFVFNPVAFSSCTFSNDPRHLTRPLSAPFFSFLPFLIY